MPPLLVWLWDYVFQRKSLNEVSNAVYSLLQAQLLVASHQLMISGFNILLGLIKSAKTQIPPFWSGFMSFVFWINKKYFTSKLVDFRAIFALAERLSTSVTLQNSQINQNLFVYFYDSRLPLSLTYILRNSLGLLIGDYWQIGQCSPRSLHRVFLLSMPTTKILFNLLKILDFDPVSTHQNFSSYLPGYRYVSTNWEF